MGIFNESISSIKTAANYAQGGIVGGVSAVQGKINDVTKSVSSFLTTPLIGPKLSSGSMPSVLAPSPAKFAGDKQDTRVKLIVPEFYFFGIARGPNGELTNNKGIVFPYTPSLSQEYTANWSETSVTHSNFKQYSYKNSSAGAISLSAEFTSQNETDACIYVSTVHLLRMLTKMLWGDDMDAGAPPPVCRLQAYGDQMFNNIPVVVQSVRIDMPKNVDYIDTGNQYPDYGVNSVPVISTITLSLLPVFSRNEQLNFGVTEFRAGRDKQGYL